MIKLYLNTITGQWFDEDGNLFGNGSPSLSLLSREQILIVVCKDTSDDNVGNWERDSSYNEFNQCSALITADNDYVHHLKGELAVAIYSGTVNSVSVKFPASVTIGLLPVSGTLRIFNAAGEHEAVGYTARVLVDKKNNVYVFSTTGVSITDDYAVGAIADSEQAPYCQAFMNVAASNLAQGEFAFDLIADSARIREATDYGNVSSLQITGLEFLPFYIDAENNFTILLKKYLLGTFALTGVQGNPGSEGDVPSPTVNQIAAAVGAQIAEGIQIETRTDGNDTQMRIWAVAGGQSNKSDWITLPPGAVVTGAGPVEFTVAGGTVTFAGSTVSQVVSNNAIHFSGGTGGILGTVGEAEYDLIDENGVNITTTPELRRQWVGGEYIVALLTGWADGNYALKPCGIKGEKGDPGDSASLPAGYGDTYIQLVAGTTNTPDYTIVVGGATVSSGAHHSIAVGANINLANSYCAAFGQNIGTSGQFQTVIGRYNTSDSNAYLIVGGGTSSSTKKNIFTVRKTGEVNVNGSLTITDAAFGTYTVTPPSIKKAATTNAAITFSVGTSIYKFAPVASGTVTFTPPTLAADECYECELWVTLGNPPATLTLPSITWHGGVTPDMSTPGVYQFALTFDGSDWFGRILLVRDDSYWGNYEEGDPGVYMVADGNLVYADTSASNLIPISGSTIYVYGSTTTYTGGTIGAGSTLYNGKSDDGWFGGVVSSCTIAGEIVTNAGTFSNCTITGPTEGAYAVFDQCLIDGEYEIALDGCTINGGTLGVWLVDATYSLSCNATLITTACGPNMYQMFTDCIFTRDVYMDGGTITGGTVTSTGSITYETTTDHITNLTVEAGATVTVTTDYEEVSSGTVSSNTIINNNPNA